jgi:hypothetical protein
MRVTLTLSFADGPNEVEPITSTFDCNNQVDPLLLHSHLTIEARQEARWTEFWHQLPKMNDLKPPGKLTFNLLEDFPGKYFDTTNTHALWWEILKTMMEAKWLLARARAYKGLEMPVADVAEDRNTRVAHLAKMQHFDLAVFRITKLEDLIVPLLYEGLGASFSFVDQGSDPQWESALRWEKLKGELKRRDTHVLKLMPDDEYNRLVKVSKQLRAQPIPKLLDYRHGIAHRVTPSVDYARLYTYREDRSGKPVYDKKTGKKTGTTYLMGATPTNPKYEFLKLYDIAVTSLSAYMEIFRELKTMPRFGLTI